MPENIVSILSSARSIAGGYAHSLAVASDGTLWGWGLNGNYQVGDGTNTNRNAPVQIGSATDWVAVAAGDYHSIALNSSGDVYGWGKNTNGQCGTGGGATVLSPTIITMPETVAINKIEAYGEHSLFGDTLTLAKVYGCGANDQGQITANGNDVAKKSTPVEITQFAGADLFAASRDFSVAAKTGEVIVNGLSDFGTGADGNQSGARFVRSALVPGVPPGENFVSLSAGEACAFLVNQVGDVWGFSDLAAYFQLATNQDPIFRLPDQSFWGYSSSYDLGIYYNYSIYDQRTDAPAAAKVAAGREHLFIIGQDGYLYSYGDNTYGQLSRTTSTDTALRTITKIEAAGSGWTNVACGGYHTLATLGA